MVSKIKKVQERKICLTKTFSYRYNFLDVKWVEDTIASMTLDEKVGQLFVLLKHSPDMEKAIYNLKTFHQGGVRWQGGDSNAVYAQNRAYQENTRIPLLIAVNCD